MHFPKPQLLVLVLILIAGSIWYLEDRKVDSRSSGTSGDTQITVEHMTSEEKASMYEIAHEISTPDGFINVEEVSVMDEVNKGNIVLVDFWTYSCINCQRTLPFLNDWHDKYGDQGLTIIGVHTPEFEFEKELENVQNAVDEFDIEYPVVLDNDYSTWRSYNNRYWPRKYLVDIDGFIVYDHIGEGAYEETEEKIIELLEERAERLGEKFTVKDVGDAGDFENKGSAMPRTPEIYFGASRNSQFANGSQGVIGENIFELPIIQMLDMFYLSGSWNIAGEYATNVSSNASIVLPYRATNVFMVAEADSPTTIEVRIDGEIIKEDLRGSDVDENGTFTVQESGLYKIIEGDTWEQHTLELIIKDVGVRAYTFTFG